jgi:putrescine transport system substrate-binding protein
MGAMHRGTDHHRWPGVAFAACLVMMLMQPAQSQQRTVNFYNWSNYIAPGVLEDFTRETGIKVVYDTFDANETLETRLLAGKSGYDVVVPTAYFLQRQIAAKIFQKLDKTKLPNLVNAWPVVTDRLAVYDPGNQYAANYMWGTTGIGYNVKNVKAILGGDAAIDSWNIVFKPENLAKFKDCGVHMLDSADDILPAALNYLGLDPNSTKQNDLEKAADLVSKVAPPRPATASRSAMPSRKRARRCSSTISPFPRMPAMSRKPTS